jgi:hypothetical protein
MLYDFYEEMVFVLLRFFGLTIFYLLCRRGKLMRIDSLNLQIEVNNVNQIYMSNCNLIYAHLRNFVIIANGANLKSYLNIIIKSIT